MKIDDERSKFLSAEGLKKVLSHISKNKEKYGETIYDEYYFAFNENRKDLLEAGKVYHTMGRCMKCGVQCQQ